MTPRAGWLDEVKEWVASAIGLEPDLEVVRERAWGIVVRVTVTDRVLFFKEPGPGGRHESTLVADIAERWPGLVPDVVAADHERSWLLMYDHGSPMWDSLDVAEQVGVLEQILPRYGEVQRASRPLVDRWLSVGVPDRRVEALPMLVDDLLNGHAWIGSLPISADDRSLVDAARDDLTKVCDELAAGPLAAALEHSDLHGGNVLVGRGAPRMVDWGDACISHPFASLFVVYQHAVAKLPANRRREAVFRLRDAYLGPWTDDASASELRDAFARATWLGYLIRALNFVHMMGAADAAACRTDVAQFLVRWAEKRPLLNDPDELVASIADQTEY